MSNNAWRCTKRDCHQIFTDETVGHEGKLLVCADCGAVVCNITSTHTGQAFLVQQQKKNYVPSRVKYQYMNRQLRTFDEGRQP